MSILQTPELFGDFYYGSGVYSSVVHMLCCFNTDTHTHTHSQTHTHIPWPNRSRLAFGLCRNTVLALGCQSEPVWRQEWGTSPMLILPPPSRDIKYTFIKLEAHIMNVVTYLQVQNHKQLQQQQQGNVSENHLL